MELESCLSSLNPTYPGPRPHPFDKLLIFLHQKIIYNQDSSGALASQGGAANVVPGLVGLRHSGGGGGQSQVHRLLLAREQAVGGSWHGLDVDLGGEEVVAGGRPGLVEGHPDPTHCPHTSVWASVSSSMTRACGVATTLCPLISMIRCPTRTPPRSAMPPRSRLQIWQETGMGHAAQGATLGTAPPTRCPGLGPHDAILHAEAQLLSGMGSADDGRGDRRAVDDAEGHQRLRLHLLCRMGDVGPAGPLGANGSFGKLQPPLGLSLPTRKMEIWSQGSRRPSRF